MCCIEGKSGCTIKLVIKILLIAGGLNLGLMGAGMLLGGSDWNVIRMLLGSWPAIEAVAYLLIGAAAIAKMFRCGCSKCKAMCAECSNHSTAAPAQNM